MRLVAVVAVTAALQALPASDIVVMMNGLPGSMGKEVAAACLRRGMGLARVALSGTRSSIEIESNTVELVPADEGDAAMAELVSECAADGKILVAIDYTVPTAAAPNAELYARHGVSFVMGTTGGDRDRIAKTVLDGKHCAVVAPNMAKQIVALQAAVDYAAAQFPGAFDGYALDVIESHQSTKLDTSGTAKAVVSSLVKLIDEDNDDPSQAIADITRVRDPPDQCVFLLRVATLPPAGSSVLRTACSVCRRTRSKATPTTRMASRPATALSASSFDTTSMDAASTPKAPPTPPSSSRVGSRPHSRRPSKSASST